MSEFHGGNRIFYNRVPKCGSRGVLSTFRPLAAKLHYTFIEFPIYSPHRLVNQSEVSIFLFKQKSVKNSTIYSLFSQMKLFFTSFCLKFQETYALSVIVPFLVYTTHVPGA